MVGAYLLLGAELVGERYDQSTLILDAHLTDCMCAVGQVKQHRLTAYRAALVGVLKAQIKSERLEPGLVGVMQLADSIALKVRALPQACQLVLASACQQNNPSRCAGY